MAEDFTLMYHQPLPGYKFYKRAHCDYEVLIKHSYSNCLTSSIREAVKLNAIMLNQICYKAILEIISNFNEQKISSSYSLYIHFI